MKLEGWDKVVKISEQNTGITLLIRYGNGTGTDNNKNTSCAGLLEIPCTFTSLEWGPVQ